MSAGLRPRVRFNSTRRGAVAGTFEMVGILLLMVAVATIIVYATSAKEPLELFGNVIHNAIEQMKAGYNRIAG